MSEASLRRVLTHARDNPAEPVAMRKKGGGPKCKVGREELLLMRKRLERTPTLTAKQLKAMVPGLENVSVRSVQRICLKRLNLPSRKMACKPVLTELMKEKRIAFAEKYRHWTCDDWKQVMFSDESHFELTFCRRNRCRRPPGSDRFNPRFTRKTTKHPAKVMAWACFSWRGRGAIEFLQPGEMMNGQRYLRVMEEKLGLFMNLHGTTHFLQDGAPCHRSKIVSAWFKERPHIKLIDWPGNSPDLNPIENAWSWMKTQLQDSKATSLPQLQEEIRQLWVTKMDDSAYLRALVESMPRRLQAVLDADGNATKY